MTIDTIYIIIYIVGYIAAFLTMKFVRNIHNMNEWEDVAMTIVASILSWVWAIILIIYLIPRFKSKPPKWM